MGNKADVDEIDMLAYLEKDKDTEVVAMYLESISNGRRFFNNLPEMPVVVLKAGSTSLGKQAAFFHTGAMASDDAIFKGAARQYGMLLADNIDHLYDITRFMALQPLPEGGRIAMITNGAGPCVMAADYIHHARFLDLAKVNTDELKRALPSFAICGNPLDLTGSATAEHFLVGIQVLEDDPQVDIILPFFVFQDAPLIDTLPVLYSGLAELTLTKPMVAVAMGGKYVDKQEAALLNYAIPLVRDPQRAIRALDVIVRYAGWHL
jgi:3-hydroxypropionyl-CoA synthetase (ADP-forming)